VVKEAVMDRAVDEMLNIVGGARIGVEDLVLDQSDG
jgi:hypothetical protein